MDCYLEEGEIMDEEEPGEYLLKSPMLAEDILVYEPLVRPQHPAPFSTAGRIVTPPDHSLQPHSDSDSNSEAGARAVTARRSSDSDSDSERRWWKRSRGGVNSSSNRFVWSSVLAEDQLSGSLDSQSNIVDGAVVQVERDVESYRLPSAELLCSYYKQSNKRVTPGNTQHASRRHLGSRCQSSHPRPPPRGNSSSRRQSSDPRSPPGCSRDRLEPLGCKRSLSEARKEWLCARSRPVVVPPLAVPEDSPDEMLVADLALKLHEEKVKLIGEVIRVLGSRKARDLFEQTRAIQHAGGMMTNDGSRRRTSGGVFFQLLRTDPEVSGEQADEVFREEIREKEMVRRRTRRLKRRIQRQMEKQQKTNAEDGQLS